MPCTKCKHKKCLKCKGKPKPTGAGFSGFIPKAFPTPVYNARQAYHIAKVQHGHPSDYSGAGFDWVNDVMDWAGQKGAKYGHVQLVGGTEWGHE